MKCEENSATLGYSNRNMSMLQLRVSCSEYFAGGSTPSKNSPEKYPFRRHTLATSIGFPREKSDEFLCIPTITVSSCCLRPLVSPFFVVLGSSQVMRVIDFGVRQVLVMYWYSVASSNCSFLWVLGSVVCFLGILIWPVWRTSSFRLSIRWTLVHLWRTTISTFGELLCLQLILTMSRKAWSEHVFVCWCVLWNKAIFF